MKRMTAFLLSITLITGQAGLTSAFADEFPLTFIDDEVVFEEGSFAGEQEASFISNDDEFALEEPPLDYEYEEPAPEYVYEEPAPEYVYEEPVIEYEEPEDQVMEDLSIEEVKYGTPSFYETEEEQAPLTITLESEEQLEASEDSGTDNDELFNDYIQRMINETVGLSERRRGLPLGARLEGMEQFVYDGMKERIQQIANGDVSDTVFTLTKDCGPYTKDELGVEAIVENGTIVKAAVDAAKQKSSYSISTVNHALLVDLPYDLYWYDKTQGKGVHVTNSYSYSATYNTISYSLTITVSMCVSEDYASAQYTVDNTKINTVKGAIQTAQQVANNTTGTAIQRLIGFKEYICQEVDYNHTAADNDDTPYGDPWQLIWVFDGDPDTKVVCEGYSKAFKYLFDLSNLDKSQYDCILASGVMQTANSSGRHMWNIVRMEDGKNYLCDVTNCDTGSVGAPDLLFMAYGPTGSWDTSYSFQSGTRTIYYTYDDNIKNDFGEEQLAVSGTAYQQSTYEVTFNAQGGTFIENGEGTVKWNVDPGTGIYGYPGLNDRSGYMFVGWSTEENGEVIPFSSAGEPYYVPERNVTLYAVWEQV